MAELYAIWDKTKDRYVRVQDVTGSKVSVPLKKAILSWKDRKDANDALSELFDITDLKSLQVIPLEL